MFKQPLDDTGRYLVERQIQGFVRSRVAWRGPAFNAPYLNLPSECARASVPVRRHASTHTNRAPTNVFHPLAHGECVVRAHTGPGAAHPPRTLAPSASNGEGPSAGARSQGRGGPTRAPAAGMSRPPPLPAGLPARAPPIAPTPAAQRPRIPVFLIAVQPAPYYKTRCAQMV